MMTQGETTKRLAAAISLMELLELRRIAAGDPNLGSNIERQLVDRELRDLETEIAANPGPLQRYVVTPVAVKRPEAHET